MFLAFLLACTPDPTPDRGPEPPEVAARKVVATLEDADRLARDGMTDDAERAWARAHVTFDDAVRAPLGLVYGPKEALLLEYRFALIHAKMARKEKAGDDIAALKDAFAALKP